MGDGGLSPALKNLDADFILRIAQVQTGKVTLSALEVTATSEKGKLKAPYSFSTFGSVVSGVASADLRQAAVPVTVSSVVKGLSVGRIVEDVAGKNICKGNLSASMDVSVNALGKEPALSTVKGKGSAFITDGEFKGISLDPVLPGVRDLPVQRIGGNFTIAQGSLRTNDFVLDSSILSGKGAGTVELLTGRLEAAVSFFLDGKPPAVPVLISGSVTSPSIALDPVGLARGAADILRSPERTKEFLKNTENVLKKSGM